MNTRNYFFLILFFSLGLLGTKTAQSATTGTSDYGNEIYTNVKLVSSESELVGWRIQIIQASSRVYVLLQEFEGVAQNPCLIEATIVGSTLHFDLPKSCYGEGDFTGFLQGKWLIGNFSNGMLGPDGEKKMKLRRISQ
ncbi:hypothetical protein ACO0LO_05285 [Undibacterium sp. TJN25]|uniref:hypothetical protein n=1 Tax=Undibacterium sp. TJN25 TaxID=3413056 RepID=UPI003BF197D6